MRNSIILVLPNWPVGAFLKNYYYSVNYCRKKINWQSWWVLMVRAYWGKFLEGARRYWGFIIICLSPLWLNQRVMVNDYYVSLWWWWFCVLLKSGLRGNPFDRVLRLTLSLLEEVTTVSSRAFWISVWQDWLNETY